jgi:hypothetical protein
MGTRVEVNIRVNSVASGSTPFVAKEELLNYGRRVQFGSKLQGAAINNKRPLGVVGSDCFHAEKETFSIATTY